MTIHLIHHQAARPADRAAEQKRRRKTERTFRCEACGAAVYKVMEHIYFGSLATQKKLAEQAQRDHCAKTGCAGVRVLVDELDAMSHEMFGPTHGQVVVDPAAAAADLDSKETG